MLLGSILPMFFSAAAHFNAVGAFSTCEHRSDKVASNNAVDATAFL